MQNGDDLGLFSTFDLSPIRRKLMHDQSNRGWDEARASAVELEYRRFLYLMKKFPEDELAPSMDVDKFWHYHILDTAKYARDCDELFGYFLHHYPYLGLGEGAEDSARQEAGNRTRNRYEMTFAQSASSGTAYSANALITQLQPAGEMTAYCAARAQAVYCAARTQVAYCAASAKPAYCAAMAKPAYCAATLAAA